MAEAFAAVPVEDDGLPTQESPVATEEEQLD